MPSLPNALILCGGAGVRLKAVTGDGPKAMASIGGRPFLEILLRQLRRNGIQRVVLAVGYRQDKIREHFGSLAAEMQLAYSSEDSPLGTGGAARQAASLIESDNVLILNGDSYTDADLNQFVETHVRSGADISILVTPIDHRVDCGAVRTNASGAVVSFVEKQGTTADDFVNAGIYLIRRELLHRVPAGVQLSLEQDLFPRWLAEGCHIRAFFWPGKCLDIGTPERYMKAQSLLAGAEAGDAILQQERRQ